jgi:manganese oxidase
VVMGDQAGSGQPGGQQTGSGQGQGEWLTFGVVFAAMCLLASVVAWGMAARAVDQSRQMRMGAASQLAATAASPPIVHLSEYKITPTAIKAAPGDTLTVINDGSMQHNLAIDGQSLATPMINPGDSAPMTLNGLPAGTYTVLCQVPGHHDLGMTAQLILTASAAPAPSTMTGMNSAGGATPSDQITPAQAAAMDAAMAKSTKAFPAKTQGLGGQPLAPTLLADGTKQFDLTAEIVSWEVSPGKFVKAWTYNGTVPGPTIHVGVGDKVRVVLHNHLPESTVIHFHGLDVPNNMDGVPYITQDPVEPGTEFTYSFVAKGPAVGMYHSHYDAENQVADGMAGAFLIGDEPLPSQVTVAQSQILPQVFFLDDSGTIGLTINGKSFPATAPVVATQGQWIEVQYYNEGNMIHPIHLHGGMPQMVTAKDGFPLANPELEDTVSVAPGERYTVLIHATEVGTWAWHCHILQHAEDSSGMFGMVTALIVKPARPIDDRPEAGRAVRFVGIVAAMTAAIAHIPPAPDHLREVPYIGVSFVLLAACCLSAVFILAVPGLRPAWRSAWIASAASCTVAIGALLLSRTVGLPGMSDDIGRWTEPLALVSICSEAVVVVAAVFGLRRRSP